MKKRCWEINFAILYSGQFVSLLTSAILQLVLIWHMSATTKSAFILSAASFVGFLPGAILGVFAGTIVDRVDRKIAMIAADLFISFVSFALVIAVRNGGIQLWLVFVVLAARSVGTAFHTPAINAAVPLIVPKEHLTKCAGYTHSIQTVSVLLGTALAGALYARLPISAFVAFDAAGALIACFATAFVHIPNTAKDGNTSSKTNRDMIHEIKDGIRIIRQQKSISAVISFYAVFMILLSPIATLYPLMSLNYFNVSTLRASAAEISYFIGMLTGGVILGITGGFKRKRFGIPFSIALIGIPTLLSGLLPPSGFWFFVAYCFAMGFSAPIYQAPVTALLQERIKPDYLGRAFGLFGSVASFALPIGLIFSGLFADRTGIPLWFAITGILCLALSALMFVYPTIRTIDDNEKTKLPT